MLLIRACSEIDRNHIVPRVSHFFKGIFIWKEHDLI